MSSMAQHTRSHSTTMASAKSCEMDKSDPFNADKRDDVPVPPPYSRSDSASRHNGYPAPSRDLSDSDEEIVYSDEQENQSLPGNQRSPAQTHTSSTRRSRHLTYGSLKHLAILANYDIVILVDDSGSMAKKDAQQGKTRWEVAREAIGHLAEVAIKFDKDGIDIKFLNSKNANAHSVTSASAVNRAFAKTSPMGPTPLGATLQDAFGIYESRFRYCDPEHVKKVVYLVITDGKPSDEPLLCKVLKKHAKHLSQLKTPLDQVGVQFVQIGDCQRATKFLTELDDKSAKRKWYTLRKRRDIVDTTKYAAGCLLDAERLLKILLGGIDKRRDNTSLTSPRPRWS